MARLIIGATTLVAALAHAPATGAHTGSHAAAALAVTDTKPGTHACTGRSAKLRATECTAWHMFAARVGIVSGGRGEVSDPCGASWGSAVRCSHFTDFGDDDGSQYESSLSVEAISMPEWNLHPGALPVRELRAFERLRVLDLKGNRFSGELSAEDARGLPHSLQNIDLHGNALTGTLPSWLGALDLMHLDLSHNAFHGAVPAALVSNCSALRSLQLAFNALGGNLPDLTRWPQLEQLELMHNNFTGTLPSNIGALRRLETLDISDNAIGGTIPSSIGACTHLRTLTVAMNMLRGTLPDSIGRLRELNRLILYEQCIHYAPPPGFAVCRGGGTPGVGSKCCAIMVSKHPNIDVDTDAALADPSLPYRPPYAWDATDVHPRVWRCSPGGLAGELPTSMRALSKLENLWIDENEIGGVIPGWLGTLPMKQLDLFQTRMHGTIPATFGEGRDASGARAFRNLHTLKLERLGLTGTLPPALAQLTSLSELSLDHNDLTGPLPPGFGALPLSILNLNNNHLSGDASVELNALMRRFVPHNRRHGGNASFTSYRLQVEFMEVKLHDNAELRGELRVPLLSQDPDDPTARLGMARTRMTATHYPMEYPPVVVPSLPDAAAAQDPLAPDEDGDDDIRHDELR